VTAVAGARVALLERTHPPGYEGALVDSLVPVLEARGALVTRLDAERALPRLDVRPPWDVVLLKSGSAAALHVAAAAEAWGIRSVNVAESTRLTRNKLAAASILRQAGLAVPEAVLAWLGPAASDRRLDGLADRPVVVKAMRSAGGSGIHFAGAGELATLVRGLPSGPYLVMERVGAGGDDLKVFVAGAWIDAIRRPFPASGLVEKRGTRVPVPSDIVQAALGAGRALGLTVYGCDFVANGRSWSLVDVNAFPGFKGAVGAADAIADEIERAVVAEGAPA